jgi:hypothetical protein
MTSRNRSIRVSPSLVIGCLALFLALGGTAFAAGKLSVGSAQIVDGSIRTVDLHDNAVKAPKIAPDAVGAVQIAENAVESPEVAPESLTSADLGTASVGSSEVQDQSLGAGDLGPDSVGSSELQASAVRAAELGPILTVSNSTTIKGGDNASVDATCPAGTALIGGGARGGFYQVALSGSYRSGNGWHVDARSGANNDTTLTAYANCLTGGSSD